MAFFSRCAYKDKDSKLISGILITRREIPRVSREIPRVFILYSYFTRKEMEWRSSLRVHTRIKIVR